MARRDARPSQDEIHHILRDVLHKKVLPELTARHHTDVKAPEPYRQDQPSGHQPSRVPARRPQHA